MFKTLQNAFKIKDIRQKLIYTFLMLVVVRLGSQLPVPGVNRTFFANWLAAQTGDAFNLLDAFTGGSLASMSIFALGINPYITSSIIIQLLTIAIPKLEEMQKDGEDGRKKLQNITRYVTVALALIEGIAMTVGFGNQGLLENATWYNMAIVVVALTAGSAFLMWVGERINQNGVGNGISIVLLINIVSRMPDDFVALYTIHERQERGYGSAGSGYYRGCHPCNGCIRYHSSRRRAQNPRSVQQKTSGQKGDWRTEHQHSDEGQHRRSYSGHLRFIPDVIPGHHSCSSG